MNGDSQNFVYTQAHGRVNRCYSVKRWIELVKSCDDLTTAKTKSLFFRLFPVIFLTECKIPIISNRLNNLKKKFIITSIICLLFIFYTHIFTYTYMYFLKIKNLRKRYYALPIIYGIVNIFFSSPLPFFLLFMQK